MTPTLSNWQVESDTAHPYRKRPLLGSNMDDKRCARRMRQQEE